MWLEMSAVNFKKPSLARHCALQLSHLQLGRRFEVPSDCEGNELSCVCVQTFSASGGFCSLTHCLISTRKVKDAERSQTRRL